MKILGSNHKLFLDDLSRVTRTTPQGLAVPEEARRAVQLSRNWTSPWQVFAKRLIDVAVSAPLLVLLAPLFVPVALAIKIGSRGPVFYPWRVVGLKGWPFTSYKLRTMFVDADHRKAELLAKNEMEGPVFKLRDDPRITWVGRWLRRYSLDELPQLYSVFIGHMSLVGPRPPLQTEYAQFNDWQKQKLLVKPGITCLWQVSGRNRIRDFDEWVRLDLTYIENWSFWMDLRILVQTLSAVVRGSGV